MRVWGPRPPWWLVRVSVVPCICVCVHPFPTDDVYRCVGLQRACRCTEGGGHGAVRDGGRGAAVGQAWGICPAPPSLRSSDVSHRFRELAAKYPTRYTRRVTRTVTGRIQMLKLDESRGRARVSAQRSAGRRAS